MITAVAMHGLPRGKEPWPIEVAVVTSHAPSAVTLHIRQGKEFAQVPMTATKAFAYRATIPARCSSRVFSIIMSRSKAAAIG